MSKKILIPIDFSKNSVNVIQYGVQFASKNNSSIQLLHITDKHENKFAAIKKIDALISSLKDNKGVKIESIIEVGNIKQDISRIAQQQKSNLVILGIHEATGLRKLIGSRAMDVIAEGRTPFLTLQNKSSYLDIKNIAVTFDIEKESIQIIKSICAFFKNSISTLNIVIGKQDDPVFRAKMNSQLLVVKRFLAKNKITCNVILLTRKNFLENLVEFCSLNDVQLMGVTYYQNTFNIFSPKFVQKLVENEMRIPILTIGGNAVSSSSQFSFLTV